MVRLCQSIARVCQVEVTDLLADFDASTNQSPKDECLPQQLKLVRTVELGTLVVIEALWERLGIGPALRELEQQAGCQVRYERALLAIVANRLCEPQSKLGVWQRWLEQIYVPSTQPLKLHQFYEAMDLLQANSSAVEEAIFFQTATLLNLEVDIIFYDTTTVSFSVDACDEEGDTQEGVAEL